MGDEKLSSEAASFTPEAAKRVAILVEEYAARLADTERAREALKTIFEAARTNMNPFELPEEVKRAYEVINEEAALGADGVEGDPAATAWSLIRRGLRSRNGRTRDKLWRKRSGRDTIASAAIIVLEDEGPRTKVRRNRCA